MIKEDIVRTIRKHYHARDHNGNYDKNNLGFGFIHYSLIRNIRPKRVLVVGSQRGYVPAICALACKDEGEGHVDFVDAGYKLSDKNGWGGIGVWKDIKDDYWKSLEIERFITMHNERTQDFIPWSGGYEYIYIDGDHSYKGVVDDYEWFWESLNEGGYMVFHDVSVDKDTDWGKCGVKRFWDELVKHKREYLTLPFEAGLGILRK